MPRLGLSATLDRVRRAVSPEAAPSDGRLLGRFSQSRDEAAFAELVRRHGPMVLAECRRRTADRHLADDAFQAVFLTLARRAARLAGWESVGGWLRQVARRVGANARRTAARRRSREVSLASGGREPPDREDQGAHAPRSPEEDLGPVVLDELGRLPDRHRTLLVLHYLEGRPQTEVAGRLGLPSGTVNRRMAEARRALGDRLRARGVAPALAGLAAAAVPADLMARAVAAGVSPEAVPAAVAALSNGVARTMLVPKLKLLAAVAVLAAGALGYGLAAGPPKPAPAPAEAPKPAAKADPKPRPKGLDRILILKSGHLVLIDPDGKAEKQLTANLGDFRPGRARLSPDGAAYATVIRVGPADPPAGQLPRFKLYVRKLTDPEPGTDLGVEARGFCWSPDGTRLAVSEPGEAGGPGPQYNHSLVDVKTGKKTELKLPAGHMVTGWTAGDKLVTQSVDNAPGRPRSGVHLMNPDGTEAWASTGQPGPQFGSPSPDGKRLLTLQATGQARPPGGLGVPPAAVQTLVLTDVATGQAARVDGYPDRTVASQDYCWSPDGKRIAYVWHEAGADGAPTDSHLVVCDPDGKNPKTVLSVKCDGSWRNVLGAPDWR